MTADEMRRAAELLDDEADALRDCHTINNLWLIYNKEPDTAARELHDEYRALAAKLRAMADAPSGWRPPPEPEQ